MTLSHALFALSTLNVIGVVGVVLNDPGMFGVLACPVVLVAAMACAVAGLPVLTPSQG